MSKSLPVRRRNPIRRTAARALAGLCALAVVAAGCSPGTEETTAPPVVGSTDAVTNVVKAATGAPKAGGKLTMGLEAETDGWNPVTNRWAASAFQVAMAVFDPLVVIGEDGQPKPYLAQSLTPSADFKQWDVKVRSGVKFHDGEPLNAAAVLNFYTKFKASSLTGAAVRPVETITAIDDLTVRFTMNQPWSTFPNFLTTQGGVIPSPKSLANPEEAAQRPVGTGPFLFGDWQRDKSLTVKKNPNYWRTGLPYLDSIEFRPIADTQTRLQSLQANDIDLMIEYREQTIQELIRQGREGRSQFVVSKGDNDVNMIMFNTSVAPFDDVRARLAMAHAVDRKQLLALTNSSDDLAARSLYQKTSPWFNEVGYPDLDLAKARDLVQTIKAEKGSFKFTLTSVSDPDVLKSVQVMVQQWQDVGIEVTVERTDQTPLIANAVTGKFQALTWRQFGGSDPDLNYTWWNSKNAEDALALNMTRNKDPQIDAALLEGRSTLDLAKRKGAYKKIQERQAATVPYLWLSHLRWTLAANNKVRGIESISLPDGGRSVGVMGGFLPMTEMWVDG